MIVKMKFLNYFEMQPLVAEISRTVDSVPLEIAV